MGSQASLSTHGQDLFKTSGAELPGYIREIARALMRNGMGKSHAIATAINQCKKWAAGGGGVNADTKAKAARAVAQWEAAKAKAHATPNKGAKLSNFLASSGVLVDFANAANKGGKKKDDDDKGKGKSGGKQRYKHGWIPVDENGKATGPPEPPKWLKDAKAKHKAAGGKTAGQLRKEAAAKEFKRKKEEAERPAKEAKEKREKAAREAKAKAEKAKREKEAAARKAETAANKKAREKEALITKAYSQAIEDKKAGRALTPQQKAIIAHVLKRRKKERGKLRKVSLSNEDTGKHHGGVNVLDFSSRFPGGQLAFRYKHNWILINPAIPSRGRHGGGIARKFGVKSGTTTKGHFEPKPGGGKKFVPESSVSHVNSKDNYRLAATKRDTGGTALKPGEGDPKKAAATSDAADSASAAAKKSGTVGDAQVAAKKHADAFVQAKKVGDAKKTEHHRTEAQSWAKKASELKKSAKPAAKPAETPKSKTGLAKPPKAPEFDEDLSATSKRMHNYAMDTYNDAVNSGDPADIRPADWAMRDAITVSVADGDMELAQYQRARRKDLLNAQRAAEGKPPLDPRSDEATALKRKAAATETEAVNAVKEGKYDDAATLYMAASEQYRNAGGFSNEGVTRRAAQKAQQMALKKEAEAEYKADLDAEKKTRAATLAANKWQNGWLALPGRSPEEVQKMFQDFYGSHLDTDENDDARAIVGEHMMSMGAVHPSYHAALRDYFDGLNERSGIYVGKGSMLDLDGLRESFTGRSGNDLENGDTRTHDEVGGANVQFSDGTHVVAMGSVPGGSVNMPAHELGHTLSTALGKDGKPHSSSPEWLAIHSKLKQSQYSTMINPYFTGERGEEEAFAEAFAVYNQGMSKSWSKERINKQMMTTMTFGKVRGDSDTTEPMRAYFQKLTEEMA